MLPNNLISWEDTADSCRHAQALKPKNISGHTECHAIGIMDILNITKAVNHYFAQCAVDIVFIPGQILSVLNPFKVRYDNATGVCENIRDNGDISLLPEYGLRYPR